MARIRTIKPEFWTDEKVVSLSPLARLLFVGLWNFVDDEGRGEFSPARLKMQILPADPADVSELLGEIRREELVTIYTVDGKEYFQVKNFEKHQKVDHRTKSKFPPPSRSTEFPRNVPPEGKGKDQGKESSKGADAPDEIVFRGSYVKTIKRCDVKAWLERYAALDHADMLAEIGLCDEFYAGQDDPPKNWFFTVSAWLKRENQRRLKSKRDADEAEKQIYAGVL